MNEKKFYFDLEKIYQFIEKQNKENSQFYDKTNYLKQEIILNYLKENKIKINDESIIAIANKLAILKNDGLVQFLKKEKYSEEDIEILLEKAYILTSKYYEKQFENLITQIEKENLLNPFYREIIKGVHIVGLTMNEWFPIWKKYIINTINKDLKNEFKNDDEIFKFLRKNNLLDLGHNNEIGDRSYSALIKKDNKYKSKSYFEVFNKQVMKIIKELENFKKNLLKNEDEIFNQKENYINYLQSLIEAFSETNTDKLIEKWSIVDEKWMKITSPIQIGHPLEYYDDHYRKAVQLEWDLRIINPKFNENKRVEKIKLMYKELFLKFDNKYKKIYDLCLANLERTQLYLGRPMLYSGSTFNGLFSAQVVPNDTLASKNFGKKIFAFADLVLENSQNKPFMILPKLIFGDEFTKESRNFLFNENEKWYKIYDIETIGHEFGHILWLDEDTEINMNKNGNFKNIEEFKATTGGLVSFFLNEEKELKKDCIKELIKRSVGLISWMEVSEVQPYYCEGLIHLKGLFENKIISFNGEKIKIDISDENYENLKKWYIQTYLDLAKIYLEKRNADDFLFKYTTKNEEGLFLPKDEKLKEFVLYYYDKYKEFGNITDNEDKKENYIN